MRNNGEARELKINSSDRIEFLKCGAELFAGHMNRTIRRGLDLAVKSDKCKAHETIKTTPTNESAGARAPRGGRVSVSLSGTHPCGDVVFGGFGRQAGRGDEPGPQGAPEEARGGGKGHREGPVLRGREDGRTERVSTGLPSSVTAAGSLALTSPADRPRCARAGRGALPSRPSGGVLIGRRSSLDFGPRPRRERPAAQ